MIDLQNLQAIGYELLSMGGGVPAAIGFYIVKSAGIVLAVYGVKDGATSMDQSTAGGITAAGAGSYGFISPDFLISSISLLVAFIGVVVAIRGQIKSKQKEKLEQRRHDEVMQMRRLEYEQKERELESQR